MTVITFVTTADHQYTIRDVLETRDHPLHGRIVILSYDELLAYPRLPRSTYVFADHERLNQADARAVTARIAALREACPDCVMLNLPDQIGTRQDIMRRLHEAGVNDFRMLPVDTPPDSFRYPVFLRRLDDHEGPKSQLIETPAALQQEIAALDPALRDRFAVTEYIDTRNDQGLHQRRAYTRIGDQLFPSGLGQSRAWVCKGEYSDPNNVPDPERELAFLQSDEDGAALRAAFDAARIQYGRADYAVVGGRPQIFEINTNPWLEPPERVPGEDREGTGRIVSNWIAAMTRLADTAPTGAGAWIEVPQATGRPTVRPSRRQAARTLLRGMRQLHRETQAMRWLRRMKLI